ncbi:MAG: hypothetical protein HY303_10505 [Candidatus Wallbacteria bacterium]|nr:hypothetical protein [Candidatus Wallbacteria bacterium]
MEVALPPRVMEQGKKCYRGIPYCTIGIVLGIVSGTIEFLDSRWLGFRVTLHGQPNTWIPLLWHTMTWSGIFYLLARFLEQRLLAREAAEIIADQYQKLVASQNQLLRSAKLAALGELSASMAHEIRNPLGIIRSSAAHIRESFQEADPNYKACEFITEEIDRLNGLITSLLRFARAKEPIFRPADLNGILQRSADFVGSELRKRDIELECYLHPGIPETTVDEDQIYQVVLELLLNASHAIGSHGRIVARTSLAPAPHAVALAIGDTGPGIPPENMDRIWDPFYTTRPEGTGLGLSVVKQIVERHKGEIRVESPPGRGTTFHIRLPASVADEAERPDELRGPN